MIDEFTEKIVSLNKRGATLGSIGDWVGGGGNCYICDSYLTYWTEVKLEDREWTIEICIDCSVEWEEHQEALACIAAT